MVHPRSDGEIARAIVIGIYSVFRVAEHTTGEQQVSLSFDSRQSLNIESQHIQRCPLPSQLNMYRTMVCVQCLKGSVTGCLRDAEDLTAYAASNEASWNPCMICQHMDFSGKK